ncbi:MAG: DUF2029 domain-containing protein [Planctomycetes bacterium]|nr:DUF2029 domain-containing protein [Planctomycetota bacterium]
MEPQRSSPITASLSDSLSPPAALAARVGWLVVALVIASGAVGGVHRALHGRPDWGDLQNEARYVWEHHASARGTAMFGYLPATSFALWPFMVWPPVWLGATLYVGSNVLATVLSIWIVSRWWLPREAPSGSFAWPALLVCANFQHALQANQLTLWTLLLCVAGLTLIGRRRALVGGLVLGLAMVIKVMPVLLVGYLLLRRCWRALIGVALAVIVFDLVPSVWFFGWQGALDEHRAWVRRARWHSNLHLIEEPLLRVHRHGTNASYAAVLTRWLRATPPATRQVILYGEPPADVVERYRASLAADECLTLDPMPPRTGAWAEKRVDIAWVPRFHVADWPAWSVRLLWVVTLAGGLGVLAWFTWRSGALAEDDWAPAAALWMLAVFWPSPMMRHYYLAWAFPAVAVVWGALRAGGPRHRLRWRAGECLAVAGLAAWGIGVACLGWRVVRWYGVHLGVLVVLMAATAWAWRCAAARRCNHATTERAACPAVQQRGAAGDV